MTKEAGTGWTSFSVDDAGGTLRDIRTDITDFKCSTPRAVQEVTGLDKFAMERLTLLADLSIEANGVFDDGSNLAHAVFSGDLSIAREILHVVSGQRLGTTPQVNVLITDYNQTRANDGSYTWTAPMVLSNGVVPTWDTV